MILNSPYISGSLTVTGNEVVTGSLTVLGGITGAITGSATSASYAANTSLLNNKDSGEFVLTGSFNSYTSSNDATVNGVAAAAVSAVAGVNALAARTGSYTTTSSFNSYTASNNTTMSCVSSTATSAIAGVGALAAQTGSYATTGSNTFIGNQTITGSIFGTGSLTINGCITSTGQIVAQTINVQQVTSSIVYSCGSNVFGTALNNTQTICGNIFSTGSLACFAGTICAPAFVGGTVSGTTGTFSSSVNTSTFLRATGGTGAASGKGIEIGYEAGDFGTIIAYDRTTPGFKRLSLNDNLHILANGNVGIGVCIPQQILAVNNPFSSLNALYPVIISQTGNAEIGGMYSTADSITNPIGAGLAFKTYHVNVGLSEKLRITQDGLIGIGTATPRAILSVEQDVTTTAEFGSFGQFTINGKTNANKNLSFGFNTSTDVGFIQAMVNGTSYNNLLLNARGGNVGVNCSSPGYNLDVCGFVNINAEANTREGTVQSLRVSSNKGNAAVTINSCSNNHYSYLTFAQGCAAKFEIGIAACSDPSYPSSLYINNNTQVGSANAAIRIASTGVTSFQCQVCAPLSIISGCIGIGMSTPASSLHIIRALGSDVINIGESGANTRLAIGQEAAYTGNYINSRNIDLKFQAYCAGGSGGNIHFQTGTDGTGCVTTKMLIDRSGQVAVGSPSTVSGIKLLVCGGGDYNALFTSDTNRSGWTIAQPGTSSPVASGLVLAGSCSFRFGTNNFYHIVMNQDGATQIFNTAGNATNTFMPSGLLCTLCGVRFGTGTTTLNNYEQGTWTPRLSNGSWTSSASGGNAGWYTRIGNLVTVGGTIQWTAGSGAQGQDLRIVCLPFVSSTAANERNVGQIGAPGGDSIAYTCSTKGQFVIVNDPNQASMYIIETYQLGSWATYIHGPTVNNAGVIYGFQITYHI